MSRTRVLGIVVAGLVLITGAAMAWYLSRDPVGSIPIAMAAYDITPPSAQRVVAIDENGIAELQLLFER